MSLNLSVFYALVGDGESLLRSFYKTRRWDADGWVDQSWPSANEGNASRSVDEGKKYMVSVIMVSIQGHSPTRENV